MHSEDILAFYYVNSYNKHTMAKKTAPLLPATAERLNQFGQRLRLARLRRRLTAKQVADRAGMAAMTLRSIERGGSGVTIGAYLAVMQVLGIESDIDSLGKGDVLGRALQDSRLPAYTAKPIRQAISPKASIIAPSHRTSLATEKVIRGTDKLPKALIVAESDPAWMEAGGFATSANLAKLIVLPVATSRKKR